MEIIKIFILLFIVIYLLFSGFFICSMWSKKNRATTDAIISIICVFLIAPIVTPILLGIELGNYFDNKYFKD